MSNVQIRSLSHRRRIWSGGYAKKVLATGPIAYWPLDESAGTVARCLVNTAQNGTYTGVTLADDSTNGVTGAPAPFFDGANDYVDVRTATLEAAWNAGGAQWTIMSWFRVANAGVWTDGADRKMYTFRDSAADMVTLSKAMAANARIAVWTGGGVTENNSIIASPVTWVCDVVVRDQAADEVRYYTGGGWVATDATIGIWASAGAWTHMYLGAFDATPNQPYHGWLQHVALWNRALTPGEIAALAV